MSKPTPALAILLGAGLAASFFQSTPGQKTKAESSSKTSASLMRKFRGEPLRAQFKSLAVESYEAIALAEEKQKEPEIVFLERYDKAERSVEKTRRAAKSVGELKAALALTIYLDQTLICRKMVSAETTSSSELQGCSAEQRRAREVAKDFLSPLPSESGSAQRAEKNSKHEPR